MALGAPFGFCLCLLLAFAVLCSARDNLVYSEHEDSAVVGRSLKMSLEDYGEPTANRGHDPSRNRGGRGRGGRG